MAHPSSTRAAPSAIDRIAGPHALGRNLVIAPGAEPPAPWTNAPRVAIPPGLEGDDLAVLADELQRRWAARERTVIELAADLDPAETDDRQPWQVPADALFERERLHHLVWRHSVDLRDPDAPSVPAIPQGAPPGEHADIRLADGRDAWVDGGPLQPSLYASLGEPVVPALTIERRLLNPLVATPTTAELAPDQLEAVSHEGAAARIIAPAGSGKTRVLTERARLLVQRWGVPASAICIVAYNNRAAAELRERTAGVSGLPQRVRTLNSLGLWIVRRRQPDVELLDERDVRRAIDRLVDMRRRTNSDPTALWIEGLSQVRLGLRDPALVEAESAGELDGFAAFFTRYREQLDSTGRMDFDEQIYRAIALLRADPQLRHEVQRSCRVMMVDEFQDLTPAHMLLIRTLAAPGLDVFGVGDDDQTIYGYAGADPKWLVRYEHWFPGAQSHPLTVNYRCPPEVVTAASQLLVHNHQRVAKVIHPRPGREPAAGALTVLRADDVTEATVGRVRSAIADGGATESDVAVLARVNTALAPVQVALHAAGIRTNAPVSSDVLNRTGVQAALAWLRIALTPDHLSPRDVEATLKRRPRRPRKADAAQLMRARSLDGLRRAASILTDAAADYVDDAEEVVAAASAPGATTEQVLRAIRSVTGLDDAVDRLDRSRASVDRSSHADDLDALCELARLEPDPASFVPWLRTHLEPLPGEGPEVVLATIHRMKGREWPRVVVHNAAAGLAPHRLSDDVEEERRIFHVALTRGAETVTVVAPAGHPSPFIAEMLGEAPVAPPPGTLRDAAPNGSRRSTDREAPTLDAADEPVFEALREWRRGVASERGVSAFIVATNATLVSIATKRPQTPKELGRCPGMGDKRMADYGEAILAVVRASG